jgi:polysaccharide export outer membrane protein
MITASAITGPLHSLATDFEPGAEEQYTIAPGDEIRVDVAGRQDISANYTLGPDGRITIPTIGSVELSGMTRDQTADALQHFLQPYFVSPFVTVGVVHYTSNHILLLGAVLRPGLLDFTDQPTLLQVLSRGGIGADSAQMNDLNNSGNSATGVNNGFTRPDRALIYRDGNELAIVDLKKLLSGESFTDIRLRRNDVVLIPVENNLISVLGAVRTPGAVRFNPQSTLTTLIAQAGGLDDKAGGNPTIHIVNTVTGTSRQVPFKRLLSPHAGSDITLHAGDVIFVPTSAFGKFAYVVDKLSPLLTVVGLSVLAAQ